MLLFHGARVNCAIFLPLHRAETWGEERHFSLFQSCPLYFPLISSSLSAPSSMLPATAFIGHSSTFAPSGLFALAAFLLSSDCIVLLLTALYYVDHGFFRCFVFGTFPVVRSPGVVHSSFSSMVENDKGWRDRESKREREEE